MYATGSLGAGKGMMARLGRLVTSAALLAALACGARAQAAYPSAGFLGPMHPPRATLAARASVGRLLFATVTSAAYVPGAVAAPASVRANRLAYDRIFDANRTHDAVLAFGSAAPAPSRNLVSDSIFDIDVQLPLFVRTSVSPVLYSIPSGSVAQTPRYQGGFTDAGSTLVTGVTFRLRGAKLQMQFQTFDPNLPVASSVPDSVADAPSLLGPGVPIVAFTGAGSAAGTAPFAGILTSDLPSYVPDARLAGSALPRPIRIGGVRFSAWLQPGAIAGLPAAAVGGFAPAGASPAQLAASASFHVRAGARRLNVALSDTYERLLRNDTAAVRYEPSNLDTPNFDLAAQTAFTNGQSPVIYYPSPVDGAKHALNARVAVPLTHDVTLYLQYGTQHFQEMYGASTMPAIDATKSSYLGNVTYRIPHTSSAITLSARQYRYQDNFVPTYNLTQTRADLDFTVKF